MSCPGRTSPGPRSARGPGPGAPNAACSAGNGNLSALLGFQPIGFVETTQPVILFCVLFGLSMDYEVFLLSRMKEVWDTTGDNTEAVARGLERSGRIVTSAALIVVVVAGSFAFADIVLIKALGLGVAIAVALDATVVRALLVPATMRLLGHWNWWMPNRLARLVRRWRFNLETRTPLDDDPLPHPPPGRGRDGATAARSLAFHPLIVGDQVLVADARYVTAYDLRTGKRNVWYDLVAQNGAANPDLSLPAHADLRSSDTGYVLTASEVASDFVKGRNATTAVSTGPCTAC